MPPRLQIVSRNAPIKQMSECGSWGHCLPYVLRHTKSERASHCDASCCAASQDCFCCQLRNTWHGHRQESNRRMYGSVRPFHDGSRIGLGEARFSQIFMFVDSVKAPSGARLPLCPILRTTGTVHPSRFASILRKPPDPSEAHQALVASCVLGRSK